MRMILTSIILVSAMVIVNCASTKSERFSAQTSEPISVNPQTDNSVVLDQLIPGLIVVIDIDGNTPSLIEAHVASIPKSPSQQKLGELININGLSDGEMVTSTAIPDQRVNAHEMSGLVILEKRTVIGALPLPQRIDTLEVLLPGEVPPKLFNVRKQIEDYCKKNPKSYLCQK